MGYCQQENENEQKQILPPGSNFQQDFQGSASDDEAIQGQAVCDNASLPQKICLTVNTKMTSGLDTDFNKNLTHCSSTMTAKTDGSLPLNSLQASINQSSTKIYNSLDIGARKELLLNDNNNVNIESTLDDQTNGLQVKELSNIVYSCKISEIEEKVKLVQKPCIDLASVIDFELLKSLGKGAFGDVFLVRKKEGHDSGTMYALKMIYKEKILEDEYYAVHFRSERAALELVRDGTFLSTLYYAFQSLAHLFLVMDYNSGGQLLQQFIGKNVLFENHMRIYLAELLVAVNFLHTRGIIHRDIKPENVLLDKEGHVVLIDYGLSKVVDGVPNESHVGTEPYIAPEILLHQPHDRMADFWSLGVLGYEMVMGEPPFSLDQSDEKLRKAVLEREPQFSAKKFHKPCKALLSGLMQKNPKNRLGAINKKGDGGMQLVMGHKFFKMIKWADVSKKKLKPPNIPKKDDLSNCKVTNTKFKEPKDSGYRNHFEGYGFSWLQQEDSSSQS